MNGTQHLSDPQTPQPEPASPAASAARSATPEYAGTPSASLPPPVAAGGTRLRDPNRKSAPLACVLSAIPGLGQVYVGYYPRGFVHALVVAALMAILTTMDFNPLIPLGVMFLIFFWLYNIIDAGRRATMYNHVLDGGEPIDLPRDFSMPSIGGSIVGGLLIAAAGVVLLLHTRFDVPLDWLADWWPLAPILFGLYLFVKGMQERSAAGADDRS